MSSNSPSSLSWRMTSQGAPATSSQGEQKGEEATGKKRLSSDDRSTSSIAMGILPAISIAVPGAASSSSGSRADTNSRRDGKNSPSSSAQAPSEMLQGVEHHYLHNPFAIGPLKQDVTEGSDQSNDGKTKSNRRHRTREKLARAGRSLSPFRHKRVSSFGRLPAVLAGSWTGGSSFGSKLLTAPQNTSSRDPSERGDDDDLESDADSIASGRAMRPKNTAFDNTGTGNADIDNDDDHDDDDTGSDSDREHRQSSEGSRDEAEEEEEEDDPGARDPLLDFDDATIDNTLFNAGCLDLHNAWQNNRESIGEGGWYPADDDPSWGTGEAPIAEEPEEKEGYDRADGVRTAPLDAAMPTSPTQDPHARLPNVILPSFKRSSPPQRKGSKYIVAGHGPNSFSLIASRPIFARNRCTITLVHGEYEKAVKERGLGGGRGPKKWIVASDGSEESSYAIEWTIGTVLRDGDELLIVSVMETSEKIDPIHRTESSSAKAALKENQEIRQNMAVVLARQATALLQRTRLAVKISCQALHAKHARHMLLDLIDFYEPTMVIVGSRGLGSLKGILLGSTSHYLVQKASCPVMVARKRLQLPALPRGKGDVVSSVRRRHMRLDEAAIEKKSKVGEEAETDTDNDGEEGDKTKKDDGGKGDGEESPPTSEESEELSEKKDADLIAKQRQEGEQAVVGRQISRSLNSADEPSPEDGLRDLNKLALDDTSEASRRSESGLNKEANGDAVKVGESGGIDDNDTKTDDDDDDHQEGERRRSLTRGSGGNEHGSSEERGRSRSRQGRSGSGS